MANKINKRITIQDLADELQTTPSTISRALRDHDGISKSMKKKVLDLAKKRNYKVNRMAANLRSGESMSLGVIVPRINRDFFSNVIAGIEDVAFESDFSIIICQTHDKIEKEKKYVKTLISSGVAGILVSLGLETSDFTHFEEVNQLNIPLIFFDRAPTMEGINKIVIDDEAGAYKTVSHMIAMGYNRIAHFAGPDHLKLYRDRKKGYLSALRDHNLEVDDKLIITHSLKVKDGQRDIERLLKLKQPPDALFSASDYSGLGALLFLKEKGYQVPDDFGVASFGNERFTSLISPSLTSVDQHSLELGQAAARTCLDEILSKNTSSLARTIMLDPQPIIRQSTLRKN